MLKYLEVKSGARVEMIDITAEVQELVRSSGIRNGLGQLFVPHTTAGITINEGADPAVQRDMIATLNRLVPADPGYTHAEGNSDAHVKSTLVGSAQTVIIDSGRLLLGTWQAIYFCEFDGPRQRRVAVKLIADS